MRVETRRTVEAVSQEMSALPIDDGYVLKEDCLSRFVNSSYKVERFREVYFLLRLAVQLGLSTDGRSICALISRVSY